MKPDFFLDEDLAELPLWIRVLYEGLWCHADKEGRLEDRPQKLKAVIFPYDKFNVDEGLKRLSSPKIHSPKHKPFIIRYEVNGERYIQILSWDDHQSPHHTEKESEIPAFNGGITVNDTLDKGRAGDAHYQGTIDNEQETGNLSKESESDLIQGVIFYLNEKTGKKFDPKSKDAVEHIGARIAEGRTIDDFRHVIDVKVAKWKGKSWKGGKGDTVIGDDLLRPSTLFSPRNFENYLNESMPGVKHDSPSKFDGIGEEI